MKSVVGKAKTTSIPGLLRVSFFWIFYSDYRVLALGENYNWALVGGSSSKYLWILSRTSILPDEDLALAISEASRRGYNTARLIYPWK
nr:lipocalin family protein [Prevotella sp.]